jgi:hypothetical protein
MSFALHRLAVLSTPALAAVGALPLAVAVLGGTAIHSHRTRRTRP